MKRFTSVQALSVSKDKLEIAPPDDVVVFQDQLLYGVFDGATSFSDLLIDGVSTGRFAALSCAQVAQSYVQSTNPSSFSVEHLLHRMTHQLSESLSVRALKHCRAATTISLAIDDGQTLHFLIVGDSGVRINGREVVQIHKPIDLIFTSARVAMIKKALAGKNSLTEAEMTALELKTRQAIAHGLFRKVGPEDIDQLALDIKTSLHDQLLEDAYQALPSLLSKGISTGQPAFMNQCGHSLGYAVMNGHTVQGPDMLLFSRPKSSIQSLEFFTDGYMEPGTDPTIRSWETQWASVEAQDPYKIGPYPHIKCSTLQEHWDDRSVLIVRADSGPF
ncbi:hypothetical protein MCEMIEM28_00429 [Burkholderiaceae bacterium]